MATLRELVTRWSFNVNDSALQRSEQRLQAVMRTAHKAEGVVRDAAGRLRTSDGRFYGAGGKAADKFIQGFSAGGSLGGISRMGLGLAALAGGQALGLGALFKTIGDNEQTEVAFEVLIGNAEKARAKLAELRQFALATPFKFSELAEGSKRLLAVGFGADELIPTMNALGNIAAGVGREKMPQLILAFGQVRTAGKLTGMELRQFTEAGVPLIEELAKVLGKPKSQIQSMVESGQVGFEDVRKALMAVTGEGGRFNGLMQKQSKTLLGVWSNLIDALELFAVKLGDRGLKARATSFLQGVVGYLNSNESRLLGTFERLVNAAIKSITWIMRLVRAIDYVVDAFGGWERVLYLVTIAMTSMMAVRLLAFLGNAAIAAGKAVMAFRALGFASMFAAAGPIAIGAALIGLLLIIEDIVAYFQGRKSITGILLQEFGSFSQFADSAMKHLDGFLEKMKGKFEEMKSGLAADAKRIGKEIASALMNIDGEDIKKFGLLLAKALEVAFTAGDLIFKVGLAMGAAFVEGIEQAMREKMPDVANTIFGEKRADGAEADGGLAGKAKSVAGFLLNGGPVGWLYDQAFGGGDDPAAAMAKIKKNPGVQYIGSSAADRAKAGAGGTLRPFATGMPEGGGSVVTQHNQITIQGSTSPEATGEAVVKQLDQYRREALAPAAGG